MSAVADIDARIYQLRRELSQACMDRARAVARERASEHQTQVQKAVVDAFDAGKEIAQGPTGMWWHESGKLIRRATADELQAADELARAGVLVRE